MAHAGAPMFYTVEVKPYVLNPRAIQERAGLELMLGPAASLAEVLGPNHDVADTNDSLTIKKFLCSSCALDPEQRLPFVLFEP